MITSKGWSTFFTSAALLACSVANISQAGSLAFTLTPREIQPGQHAVLEVRLPMSELKLPGNGEEIELPAIHDDLLTSSKQFQLLATDHHTERKTLVWSYEITTYKVGTVTVPPVELRIGPESFSTESVQLKISSSRPDGDDAIRAEFGTISPPIPWGRWLGRLFFLLILAAVGGVAYLYRHRWLKQPVVPIVTAEGIPVESDLDWLRRQLAAIRERLAAAPESDKAVAPLIDETTTVLRQYFARRTQRPVDTWTTREFRHHLRTETAQQLYAVFERCDGFKFAPRKAAPRPLLVGTLDDSERVLLAAKAS